MINTQKINIGDIMLEKESHTYRLIDLKTDFTSVTEFIHQFFEKFDKEKVYVKKWISEYDTTKYPQEIVNHKLARERCLKAYKEAVS